MAGPLHNTKGSAKAERLRCGTLQPPVLKGEGHSAAGGGSCIRFDSLQWMGGRLNALMKLKNFACYARVWA